jgi:hypothetical protein
LNVALLRADSGFSDRFFLNDLDRRNMHYLISLRLNQPLQSALADETGWWVLDDGIELIALIIKRPVGRSHGGLWVFVKRSMHVPMMPKTSNFYYR